MYLCWKVHLGVELEVEQKPEFAPWLLLCAFCKVVPTLDSADAIMQDDVITSWKSHVPVYLEAITPHPLPLCRTFLFVWRGPPLPLPTYFVLFCFDLQEMSAKNRNAMATKIFFLINSGIFSDSMASNDLLI